MTGEDHESGDTRMVRNIANRYPCVLMPAADTSACATIHNAAVSAHTCCSDLRQHPSRNSDDATSTSPLLAGSLTSGDGCWLTISTVPLRSRSCQNLVVLGV